MHKHPNKPSENTAEMVFGQINYSQVSANRRHRTFVARFEVLRRAAIAQI